MRRPSQRAEDRFGLDSALLLAYMASFGILLALLPLGGSVSWSEIAPGLGLQVLVGVFLVFGPRMHLPAAGLIGILAYLTSVALLRDGTSPTAGYGPLVLLPVVWASLRGGRTELVASLLGVAAVYLVPTLLVGPPQYPVGGWRAGLLFVVIASIIGLAVRQLVQRVEQLLQRLSELARTDDLTGLPNRRAWQELLRRESVSARRTGSPLTVALVDLDRFKQYNDSHGHLAGDRLLVAATAAWRSALRETDVLARWGGDEFVLLLPNCDLRQTQALLERMRAICPTAPFSAGMAESDGDRRPETLLALADEALYRAKREGGAPAAVVAAVP
ncbi:MAG TPA: diguanylate cyclase [Solirubrobacteraceae bacterium]|nr:diguanylate cyclase [Solirubrobacteraceae bacterium]